LASLFPHFPFPCPVIPHSIWLCGLCCCATSQFSFPSPNPQSQSRDPKVVSQPRWQKVPLKRVWWQLYVRSWQQAFSYSLSLAEQDYMCCHFWFLLITENLRIFDQFRIFSVMVHNYWSSYKV
jgi:hypothetical protein